MEDHAGRVDDVVAPRGREAVKASDDGVREFVDGAASRRPTVARVPRRRRAGHAVKASGRRSTSRRARDAGESRSTLGRTRPVAGFDDIDLLGLAGARGSRTHRATPSAAPPVLKTGGPTGTPPLPRAMVARLAHGAGPRPDLSSSHDDARRSVTDPADQPDRLRRLCCEARGGPAGGRAAGLRAEARSLSTAPHRGPRPARRAAAYRVSDDLAIIGTLDFFPPLVDDPRTFGEIAASNALSDVFAMGGRVLFALSIAAFPEDLPRDVLAAIFEGASSKVREAGGRLAGGHTIRDPEPKYGLAVIGAAHPDKLLRKGGARAGDRLLLTKPLGTGMLVCGSRQGRTEADLATAIAGMRTLNRAASEVLVAAGLRAATDVTGFGLLGRPGDGARVRDALRVRRRGAAGAARSPGTRRGRGRDRRRCPQPTVRGARARRRGRGSRRSSRSPTTRRPPGVCWPRSPRRLGRSRRGGPSMPPASRRGKSEACRPGSRESR